MGEALPYSKPEGVGDFQSIFEETDSFHVKIMKTYCILNLRCDLKGFKLSKIRNKNLIKENNSIDMGRN